jgi:hypothetical protein
VLTRSSRRRRIIESRGSANLAKRPAPELGALVEILAPFVLESREVCSRLGLRLLVLGLDHRGGQIVHAGGQLLRHRFRDAIGEQERGHLLGKAPVIAFRHGQLVLVGRLWPPES